MSTLWRMQKKEKFYWGKKASTDKISFGGDKTSIFSGNFPSDFLFFIFFEKEIDLCFECMFEFFYGVMLHIEWNATHIWWMLCMDA